MNNLRDRIMAAIREADSHSCMYQEGIDAAELADAVMGVLAADRPGTCDASMVMNLGFFGGPAVFGPCVLHRGHDGPAHKGANGAQWCPNPPGSGGTSEPAADGIHGLLHRAMAETLTSSTAEALADAGRNAASSPLNDLVTQASRRRALLPPMISYLADGEEPDDVHNTLRAQVLRFYEQQGDACGPQKLTVKAVGVTPPSCESGRHPVHPGDTCEEADEYIAACNNWSETWARHAYPVAFRTLTGDVPSALRGPNYPSAHEDPAPLRKLAEQAIAAPHIDATAEQS